VLQCDIRQFFPSIDYEILCARLAARIRDERTLALARLILESSNPQPPADFFFPGDDLFTPSERRRGLPIGNLTSQFWANVYLDPIDHFFKDELGAPGYIRYVDDFLVFSNDKSALAQWREECRRKLGGLRLLLHERKCRIYLAAEGIPFLGFRVFSTHRRLRSNAVKRARRRMTRLSADYAAGKVNMTEVGRSVQAWVAHASHGDTYGLRRSVLPGPAVGADFHCFLRPLEVERTLDCVRRSAQCLVHLQCQQRPAHRPICIMIGQPWPTASYP
jgi:hypothetical protein